jgi:hypothetical protein
MSWRQFAWTFITGSIGSIAVCQVGLRKNSEGPSSEYVRPEIKENLTRILKVAAMTDLLNKRVCSL